MVNQQSKPTSRISRQEKSIQLCSRCISNEVNSWVSEKWKGLDEETKKQIREELKTIKLISGKCIVCSNNLVATKTSENILKILEENKTSEKLKKEFRKFFVFGLL